VCVQVPTVKSSQNFGGPLFYGSEKEQRRGTALDSFYCTFACNMLPPPVRYGLAGVLGGLYGVMVSWVVNCTLVEISVNTFFAVVSRR